MSVPPLTRREQIEALSREIDRLIARYQGMPPGRSQSIVVESIEEAHEKIRQLQSEQHAEDLVTHEKASIPVSRTKSYQALAVGIAMVVLGILLGSYLLASFGGLVIFFSASSATRSPSASPKPVPEQDHPGWKP